MFLKIFLTTHVDDIYEISFQIYNSNEKAFFFNLKFIANTLSLLEIHFEC